jgi:hypothetical protein
VGDNLALLAQVTSGLITGLVIAFVADWKLTLIILCAMPLSGAQGYAQVKFLKGFSQDAKVIYVKKAGLQGVIVTTQDMKSQLKLRSAFVLSLRSSNYIRIMTTLDIIL